MIIIIIIIIMVNRGCFSFSFFLKQNQISYILKYFPKKNNDYKEVFFWKKIWHIENLSISISILMVKMIIFFGGDENFVSTKIFPGYVCHSLFFTDCKTHQSNQMNKSFCFVIQFPG